MIIAEICCGSYEDCKVAFNGGAKRVELNSALHLGGLTPSVGSLVLTKKNTDLKVITMIRPRAAGFCYSATDIEIMFLDCKIMLENNSDGIAFGFLNSDCTIDIENAKKMVELIRSYGAEKEVVFHRAFDCVNDPHIAIKQLIDCGVDRILTSGLESNAINGKNCIKELLDTYNDQIQIVAGCGLHSENVKNFIEYTNVKQVHSSCKSWNIDKTTTTANVSYAYHNEDDYEIVCFDKVVDLLTIIKEM